MNRIFAEFISPVVSHLHRADMTINKIYFEEKKISNIPPFEVIFTNEIINLLHQLLEGLQVSLKEEQVKKLEIIAILFGNDDFLNTLHDLLPIKYEDDQITDNLMKVEAIECISKNTTLINCDITKIIEYLSEHFHMIDEKEIKKIPKSILIKIITNNHLKLKDEDWLFDIIKEKLSEQNNVDECDDSIYPNNADFYEAIEVNNLSDNKFTEFVSTMQFNLITNSIWSSISSRIENKCKSLKDGDRYVKKVISDNHITESFLYNGNQSGSLQGIVFNISQRVGGITNLMNIMSVGFSTSVPKKLGTALQGIIDFNNQSSFRSHNLPDQWIQYDFKDHKIQPTHYSIRSSNYNDDEFMQNWVIEGSNDISQWKVLDTRTGVTNLIGLHAIYTFEISEQFQQDDFYRFIRIRMTGPNNNHTNILNLSALEYFGILK